MPSFHHVPVLLAESMVLLEPAPGKTFVDGTLGGGSHARAMLAAGARVIGIDQDPAALAAAADLAGEQFIGVRGSFADAGAILDGLNISQVDGVLLDLGVSSHQIDTPERGFSFQHSGPLDMRMNPDAPMDAATLVATLGEEELATLFFKYGDERASRRIARQIVRERDAKPIRTTLELAALVERVVPRHGKSHPATRVFQALRIAVNRELEVLESALAVFADRLAPGGRMAVITFHSLEDRIVKNTFRLRSTAAVDRPEWPAPRRNPEYCFRLLTPKPLSPGEAELAANPRSRSARIRAVEKLSTFVQ